MTTTQTAPSISVQTTAPTREDAQIMLQLAQLAQSPSIDRGQGLLWATEEPPSYDEFCAKYPKSSQEFGDVMNVIKWYETVGTLVKQGLLSRTLVYDWLWVSGTWDRCRGIALGQREKTIPQMWENFEALADGQRAADTSA